MFIVELVCFIFFIIYLSMGIYSIIINPKALANRLYLIITVIFAGWSLAALFMNIFSAPEFIMFWGLSAVTASSFGSAMIVHFSYALINENKIRKNLSLLTLIYLPAFVFAGFCFNYIFMTASDTGILGNLYITLGSSILYFVYILFACVKLNRWGKNSEKKREKIQSRLISSALLIATLFILIYGTILPLVVNFVLPYITPLFPMIWVSAMWIAITKYRLMAFRPDIATNEIMDNVLDIIILADHEGKIIDINKRTEDLLNYRKEELNGKRFYEIVFEKEKIMNVFVDLINSRKNYYKDEDCFFTADNKMFPVRFIITTVKNVTDEVIGLVIAAQDLRVEKQYMQISVTDKLTQIYNRLKLDEVIEYEITRSSRTGQVFSLIIIDIDHFKSVNDTYGHQEGDRVLIKLAETLKKDLRKSDTFGRWGGEEFLIILPDTTVEYGMHLAEKLRKTVEDCDFNLENKITCSFGITGYTENDSINNMISRADKALYKAKNSGRNRVEKE